MQIPDFSKVKGMTLKTKLLLSLVGGTLISALIFYFELPAINIHSTQFLMYLAIVIALYTWPFLFSTKQRTKAKRVFNFPINIWVVLAIAAPLIFSAVFSFFSAPIFNAKRYANVIDVKEAVFSEDMKETEDVTNVALMDTESAIIIGNRALGSLSDVVSQYELSQEYSQINYKGRPQKVSNLEYIDFFKWFNNRKNGIPGYVMVDPVKNTSDYVKFDKPMYYAESAYFSKDLYRALRFKYPTKIFDVSAATFELDDNGTPYYIVSCYSPKVGLFGAMDVTEVIIFNPQDGSSEIFKVEDSPAWIDIVFDGHLACQKYNWKGELSGGFWNSVIGNKGCKRTTADFGYVVIEDDVWYFTGVTSVTADQSNIGFILSNARTGEYKYYPVVGAEEFSAMKAAEGEVQEKGYRASFPSLVNVSGQATYILVLKDSGGLVKLYALVNVEQYSIVATGETQEKAMAEYKKLLYENNILEKEPVVEPEVEKLTKDITVKNVRLATVSGETVVYVTAEDGAVFKGDLKKNESLILIEQGDKLSVEYSKTDIENIFSLISFKDSAAEKLPEPEVPEEKPEEEAA